MKFVSPILNTVAFLIACLIWLVAGLTVLGPRIGEQFFSDIDNGPTQPLETLTCPRHIGPNEQAELVARFANHSGKAQQYTTTFESQNGTTPAAPISLICQPTVRVADGEVAEARCTVGPVSQVTHVRVTAWAEGENYMNTCDTGCPNSYRDTCTIMPEFWSLFMQPGDLTGNGLLVLIGMILVVTGVRAWPCVWPASRVIMGIVFAIVALLLAYTLTFAYGSALAGVLVIGPIPEAILVAWLWLRWREQRRAAQTLPS